MDAAHRWGTLVGLPVAVFLLAGVLVPQSPAMRVPAATPRSQAAPARGTFPPELIGITRPGSPASGNREGSLPEEQIRQLGRQPARYADAARNEFASAPDLAQFALDRLGAARDGDAASQYLIYLALDQCRSYLRLDRAGAAVMLEHIQREADQLMHEELAAYRAEYERCHHFAGGDWTALGEALGPDQPGAEAEYASVWFQRALHAGHPAALAEQALRLGPFDALQRGHMLAQALAAGDPDVYWLVFAHSAEVQESESSAPALAWLIVSCRAGGDCSESARWYRQFACSQLDRSCPPGQSALEHYWYSASAWEREQAWELAARIEQDLLTGSSDGLPLPELAWRDSRRLERDLR